MNTLFSADNYSLLFGVVVVFGMVFTFAYFFIFGSSIFSQESPREFCESNGMSYAVSDGLSYCIGSDSMARLAYPIVYWNRNWVFVKGVFP